MVRIREPFDSEAFWKAYATALAEPKPKQSTGSLSYLCDFYFRSPAFKRLAPSTRDWRRRLLDRVCAEHGEKPFARMEPRHVRALRDEMIETPFEADKLLKALRKLFEFGMEQDLLNDNPARKVKFLRPRSSGFHTWSWLEIEQYVSVHPVGTKAHLAFALLAFTGQRRSDVVRMGPQHVRDGWIIVNQIKGGRRIEIPILPQLQATLDVTETGHLAFLTTAYGKPFSVEGFGNRFRDWCNEAELPHCTAHGLRKAGASAAAENGATASQLQAIFRFTLAVAEHLDGADQRRLKNYCPAKKLNLILGTNKDET